MKDRNSSSSAGSSAHGEEVRGGSVTAAFHSRDPMDAELPALVDRDRHGPVRDILLREDPVHVHRAVTVSYTHLTLPTKA